MNPVEIYKVLPKTNCGKCPSRTCMAFAVKLSRGETTVQECPCLDSSTREMLKKIRPFDWRKHLLEKLRQEVKGLDFSSLYRGIGAEYVNGALRLRCLGRWYTVTPDGEVLTEKDEPNIWICILILHYIKTQGRGSIAGKWVDFSELKSGMVKVTSFRRDCEEPLKELCDRDIRAIDRAMKMLGATIVTDTPAEYSWLLYLLPKIPVMVLYWSRSGSDESSIKILFDRTADRFLDVESIVYLMEGFVHLLNNLTSAKQT